MPSTHRRDLCTATLTLATLWLTPAALADELPVFGSEVQLAEPSLTTRGGAQTAPDIACTDDGRCLLVWYDTLRTESPNDVMGAFMAADGGIGAPFLVAEAPDSYRFGPSVATDGRDFVVTWSDDDKIRGVRLDHDGQLGDVLDIASGFQLRESGIAATRDGRFLVVWQESAGYQLNTFISGVFVEPDDTVSPEFIVSEPTDPQGHYDLSPSVASAGTRLLVTWIRYPRGVSGELYRGELRGVLVEADGELGEQLALGAHQGEWWPAGVIADGDGFLAAWSTPRTPGNELEDIVVARVGADGTVTQGAPVLTPRAGVQRTMASLGSAGQGRTLLTWAEGDGESFYEGTLRAVVRQADGTWSGGRVLLPGARGMYERPAIAYRADRHVVVWAEEAAYLDDVMTLDVSDSGEPLDNAARPVVSGPTQHAPRVIALGDERFLAMWGEGGPEVAIAVLGADGQVLDRAALSTHASSGYCLRAARDGDHVLVTWSPSESDASAPSWVGVWLDGDGRQGTKLALPVDVWDTDCLPVATDGEHFLVVWEERGPLDAPRTLSGVLLEPGAPTAEPFTIATLPAGVSPWHLKVAGAPDAGFLVGWRAWERENSGSPDPDLYGITAIRVAADGSVGDLLPIASDEDFKLLHGVVADDAGFTLFWREYPYDIATRIDLDGVVHEPRIVAEPDEGSPGFVGAIARDGDRVIAAWQGRRDEGPTLAAAVWDGEQPPVALDTEPASVVADDVQIAWRRDRGMVVYTRDYRVYARPIGVDRPEPPEPPEQTDVSEAEDVAADAGDVVESPLPTTAPMADPTGSVSRGCCTAVRTGASGSGASAWWGLLGLLALGGVRSRVRFSFFVEC